MHPSAHQVHEDHEVAIQDHQGNLEALTGEQHPSSMVVGKALHLLPS